MKLARIFLFAGFILFLLLFYVSAQEYQWPVDTVSLTGTFGEDRWDHFHSGIDLGGGEQDIFPVAEGELVFEYNEHSPSSMLPSGIGTFIVAEHTGGVRSLYAHLKNGSAAAVDNRLQPEIPLGRMGESGGSLGIHLHLTIIDSDTDNIINPLLILPPRIDSSKPKITGVSLVRGQETVKLGSQSGFVPSGRWDLVVDVYDQCDSVSYFWPMSPYRVMVYVNGSEAVYLTYEFLAFNQGAYELVKSPGFTYKSFYEDETKINLGPLTLNPGETSIEVVVSDFAGNETIYQKGISIR